MEGVVYDQEGNKRLVKIMNLDRRGSVKVPIEQIEEVYIFQSSDWGEKKSKKSLASRH